MTRKAFLLKNNWIEIFDNLSDRQAGMLIKALFQHNVNGDKPSNLTDVEVKAYFNVMLLECNATNERYDRRCETSANNGKLGGRPPKDKSEEKPNKPNSKPKKPNNPNIIKDNNKDNIITPPISTDVDICPPQKNDDDILFEDFQKWLNKNAPNVQRLKEPFTKDQFLRIRTEYDKDTVAQTILRMHNWKDLTKKNVSANLTFRTWVAKDRSKN